MKYFKFVSLLLVMMFFSCEEESSIRQTACVQPGEYDYLDGYKEGSMCTTDMCTQYLAIWKELIIKNNNLSEEFFDNHIELVKSGTNTWNDGISFRVFYKVKFEWAIAYNSDHFIIKINPDNSEYSSLDLPRDTYLTKENVKIVIDKRAFSSKITKLTNSNEVKFISMANALNDLIEFSGVNTLCSNRVYLNDITGNLMLEAWAQYENEENSCIQGKIDLITGDKEVNDTPCLIN